MTETKAVYGEILTRDIELWASKYREKVERVRADLWDLIDHLADGYQQHGDLIFQYIDETDFSLGYLRNLLTTGLNFPHSRRVNLPTLPPAHFQVVNSLEPDDQDAMLWWAAEKGLSRDELRQVCKEQGLIRSRDYVELALENDQLQARNDINGREIKKLQTEVDELRERAECAEAQAAEASDKQLRLEAKLAARDVCPECGWQWR